MTFETFCGLVSAITHVPRESLHAQTTFRDDLGIDSLQMVNLLVQLSERLGIGFEQLAGGTDLSTVGGLYLTLGGDRYAAER